MTPVLSAEDVRFSYGKNEILHGVNFSARQGES